MSICFYCKNFNEVTDNLVLKGITRLKMSDIRRIEPLNSLRVNSPIFLSEVECVFLFGTSCHKHERGKEIGGVIAICFNVLCR